jgi:preprotein translocase subunit SecD
MPPQTTHARPGRVLAGFAAFVLALAVLLIAGSQWGSAQLTPQLGLDLEGGTQLVLTPELSGQQADIEEEQLDQARDIISQRADAGGIAGAEVTTQGGRNIVVSMPGVPPQETEDAIRRSSQLQFRPVLVVLPTTTGIPELPTPSPTDGATDSPAPGGTETATAEATPTTDSGPVPEGFAAEATPTTPVDTPRRPPSRAHPRCPADECDRPGLGHR